MRRVPALADDAASASWRNAAALDIAGITADSRRVTAGYLFAALPGNRGDGRDFIAEAVSRGAAAVLAPEGTVWPAGVPARPLLEDPEPRRRLAQLAAGLAGRQPDVVVAVTGTNGKTSTVEFLRQIWSTSRKPAASLGTLGLIAPGFDAGPGLTTPDPVDLGRSPGAACARRHSACGDRGVVAWPRPVPAGRRSSCRRGVHQSDAGPPGLSRIGNGLPDSEIASVRRASAGRRACGGEQRHGCRLACRADRHRAPPAAGAWHGWRGRHGNPPAGRATATGWPDAAYRRSGAVRGRSHCRCLVGSRPITP